MKHRSVGIFSVISLLLLAPELGDTQEPSIVSLNDIVDAAKESGQAEIILPPGRFSVSETIVQSGPFSIKGAGPWLTELIPDPGVTCFELSAPPGQARRPWSASPEDKSGLGIRLSGFHIRGTRGTGQKGVVFRGQCDEIRCDNLRFENLDQAISAVELHSSGRGFIRESLFCDIVVYSCGTMDLPAAEFRQQASPIIQDGTNHVVLQNWTIVWSPNMGLLISDESKSVTRFVTIDGIMAHGSSDKNHPSGPVISVTGGIHGVQITGLRGTAFADSIVHVGSAGGQSPQDVYIQGQVSGQSLGLDLVDVTDCVVSLQSFSKFSPVRVSDRCVRVEIR